MRTAIVAVVLGFALALGIAGHAFAASVCVDARNAENVTGGCAPFDIVSGTNKTLVIRCSNSADGSFDFHLVFPPDGGLTARPQVELFSPDASPSGNVCLRWDHQYVSGGQNFAVINLAGANTAFATITFAQLSQNFTRYADFQAINASAPKDILGFSASNHNQVDLAEWDIRISRLATGGTGCASGSTQNVDIKHICFLY